MQADQRGRAIVTPIRDLSDVARIEREPLESHLPFSTTFAVLQRCAALYADRPALKAIELDTRGQMRHVGAISHRQLLNGVTRMAALLRAVGVHRGEPVAIILNNHIETHLAIWGAEAAGVACLINPLLDPVHMAGILRAVGAKVLVTESNGDTMSPAVATALRQAPGIEHLLVVKVSTNTDASVDDARLPTNLETHVVPPLATLCAREADFQLVATAADASSFLHTGGTTGAPKVAMRTHLNETSQAWVFGGLMGFEASDVVLCGLPLFHANAMLVTGLAPLSRGGCVLLAGSRGYRNPKVLERFWSLGREFGVTHFSGVPTIYSRLLDTFDAPVSSLKVGICGAAPMPRELMERFQLETGARVIEGYGLTEGGCVSTLNPIAGTPQQGSIGIRIPYQQMKAVHVDDSGTATDCAPGETGVLAIKGPNVFRGYLDPLHNVGTMLPDGWLLTGDIGRIEPDGFVYLRGRAKDVIIRGGHNIDPSLAEDALHRHPAVALAAVVGQPNRDLGEVPVAFVTLQQNARVDAETLVSFAREQTGERAAAPVAIYIVDALPVTPVGKIFKPELRRRATELAIRSALASEDLPDLGVIVALDRRGQVFCDLTNTGEALLPRLRNAIAPLGVTSVPAGAAT